MSTQVEEEGTAQEMEGTRRAWASLRSLKDCQSTYEKAKAIRAKVYAGIFYGCEAADVKDVQIEQLAGAVIHAYHTRNNNHDRDWWFTTASEGRDVDPHLQCFIRRCIALRRAIVKRPQTKERVTKTIVRYARQEEAEKWWRSEHQIDTSFEQPAAMNGKESTAAWRHRVNARGPVGLFVQSLHTLGCKVDKLLRIWQLGEPPPTYCTHPTNFLERC